ncbi:MAG TPA: hypothetical protein VFH91_01360, partial [Pyrinomonadaceae bacterium]|nr:hypothetical protein [Pyrinomonadaceae bacterium]
DSGYASFRVVMSDTRLANSFTSGMYGGPLPFEPTVTVETNGIIRRLLVSKENGKGSVIFGYELEIVPLPNTRQFSVIARPLDPAFASTLHGRGESTPTLVSATGPRLISDRETFALDLLVNEQRRIKFVDYVRVALDKEGISPGGVLQPPRDFTLANVELSIKNYLLVVNGEVVPTLSVRHDCTGSLIWFSDPEGGRFIFSLVPYPGMTFQKVGVIEDNRISFSWKNSKYEWISTEPIVGTRGRWNLWVLHDRNYGQFYPVPSLERPKNKNNNSTAQDLWTNPMGIIKRESTPHVRTLQKQSEASPAPPPIRIQIGGATTIKELLPDN